MDINQLRYFISVAQTLNFSEAARRHGITQPTISHHIGELEKQLDCRLLNRSKRSVELTEAGRVFLGHAVQMVDIAEKASFQVQQAQAGQTGSITISALTTSSAILSSCLSVFATRYPNITVDMNFTSGQTQILAMSENRFDFHFAVEEMVPLGSLYTRVITKHDRLCLAFPADHPLAREPLDFSKLTGERFISVSESDSASLYGSIEAVCRNRNFYPRVVCKCDRAEAVLLSVGAGMGISIIPEALGRVFYDDNVVLRPIPGEDAERTYVIAWQKERLTPAARLFQEVVEELYGPAESR